MACQPLSVIPEVMVLQQEVSSRLPSDVSVYPTSNAKCSPKVSGLEPLLDFEHDRLLTLNDATLQYDTLALFGEGEGVAHHKWVFVQPDFVDGPVAVPAIPVVGVFSRSNLAP